MRTVRSRTAALFVASAAVLLVAACGGNSSGSSGGGQNGGNNAFAAYTQCLAKNGVTITMPSRGARTGAGAVVTKSVPPDTLSVGMPARAVRKLK